MCDHVLSTFETFQPIPINAIESLKIFVARFQLEFSVDVTTDEKVNRSQLLSLIHDGAHSLVCRKTIFFVIPTVRQIDGQNHHGTH